MNRRRFIARTAAAFAAFIVPKHGWLCGRREEHRWQMTMRDGDVIRGCVLNCDLVLLEGSLVESCIVHGSVMSLGGIAEHCYICPLGTEIPYDEKMMLLSGRGRELWEDAA